MDEHNDQFPEALRQRLYDLSPSLPGKAWAGEQELLAQAHVQIGRARRQRLAWRVAAAGGLAACLVMGAVLYHADPAPSPGASAVAAASQGQLTSPTMADALRAARSLRQSGRFTQTDVDHIAMASVSIHQEGQR